MTKYTYEDYGKKKVKIGNNKVNMISVEEFPKGAVCLGKITSEAPNNEEDSYLLINSNLFKIDEVEDKDTISGYVKTVEGYFLAVCNKRSILFFILIFLITLGLLSMTVTGGYYIYKIYNSKLPVIDSDLISNNDSNGDGNSDDLLTDFTIADSDDGDDIELNKDVIEGGENTFVGYSEAWVDSENKTIPLVNKKTNTAYVKYTIMLNDSVIYETDYIKPDGHIDWNAYDSLKPGKYNLTQICSFYEPVYENNKIKGFIKCDMDVANPAFTIEVR